MKIAVVGGTGNISTPVVASLVEAGHQVTCVNRGLSGPVPDGVELLAGDRDDLEWFVPAMRAGRFDAAIDFISFTADHARADVEAFQGVGHFIQVSTVVVFGNEFDWVPVTEDHPLRPTIPYGINKVANERLLMEKYYRDGFPVTVIRPSTTYGHLRMMSQTGLGSAWISRIREGKPIIKVGDGQALHQFLHVDDAGPAFVGALGRERCIGQSYELVHPELVTWEQWQRAAMTAIGREVDQVGVPVDTLNALSAEKFGMVSNIFAKNLSFSTAKITRDIPEFSPRLGIEEGLARSIANLDAQGLLQDSGAEGWQDQVIAAQLAVGRISI